jgi:transcriptional regulator GlxA family with amidase domain
MSPRTVCILLYPDCQSLDVSGPYEVFAGANQYLNAYGKPPTYKLLLVAAGPLTVTTESGLRLRAPYRNHACWR